MPRSAHRISNSLAQRPCHRHSAQRGARGPQIRRPVFEPLEDRRLLAITVSTLSDVVDGDFTPGNYSLREAIANAASGETIQFSVTGSIQLTNVGHAGEIVINKHLNIVGPGANQLTIRAYRGNEAVLGDGSRIFNINDGVAAPDRNVSISGVTLTGGDVNGKGGAIYLAENLTISNSTLTGNLTTDVNGNNGGAIYNILGNLAIANCTLSGNHAGDGGGAVFTVNARTDFGATTISGSTLSGNTARFSGGAVFNRNGPLTIADSTLSANSGGYAGGALFNQNWTASLKRVTITANSAPANKGGGIASQGNPANPGLFPTFTQVYSSIVSDNVGDNDVAVVLGGSNSFVSQGYNMIGSGTSAALAAFDDYEKGYLESFLAPLANNGGPTLTHAPLSSSPAINRGDRSAEAGGPDTPANDQRGPGFARVVGKQMDIGAFEYQSSLTVTVDTQVDEYDLDHSAGDLSLREALEYADLVMFAPNVHIIQLSSLFGSLNILGPVNILGPGANQLAIHAPSGGGRVFFIDNGLASLAPVSISGLTVRNGQTVSDGAGILNRENLTLNQCVITENTTQQSGGGLYNSGIVTINQSTFSANGAHHATDATLSHGAGIYNAGTLTMTQSTLTGNDTEGDGGGLYSAGASNLFDSTIDNNRAHTGGGLFVHTGVTSLNNSTVSSNVAVSRGSFINIGGTGGGIYNESALVLDLTTVALNKANLGNLSGAGAGIYTASAGQTTIANSLLAGNQLNPQLTNNLSNLAGSGAVTTTFTVSTGAAAVNALADNGGFTRTHSLPPSSPAIDAGNPASATPGVGLPFFDQRGLPYTRVYGGRLDVGSVESQVLPTPSPDFDASGEIDALDFLAWQRGFGAFGAEATRTNGNADVDLDVDEADYAAWAADYGEPASAVVTLHSAASSALTPELIDAAIAWQQAQAELAPRTKGRTALRR